MANYVVSVSDQAVAADFFPVEQGLNAFNDEITGISDRKPLSVLVKDANTGEVIGGMIGRTSLGLLFIDLVYLPPVLRGQRLGETLLRQFEEEGRQRGCISGFLYTISFQAPEFYKKNGWQEFGRIDCLPEGTSRIFLRKQL
ncbi:GNAT family N-acetyltransferase [Kosakonia sacchari]|uniref:GNAT family N-acetyltransferase n=1 Tax=Kosakonia sacchari TaxID=1158459 RepID=UPI002ACDBFD5|nr:GNAT family N-acetyltransferase [Kosakonia sacchari]MDZ7321981.1 GNAT family N-acetyltransferase [Kosakonia sacchari]